MKTLKPIFYIVTITVIVFINQTAICQYGGGRHEYKHQKEKIQAQKIAYITDRLDLSPEEAEKFWPLYNMHRDKIKSNNNEFGEKYGSMAEKVNELSNDEAEEFVLARLDHEQELLNFRKSFLLEVKTVLSPKKVLLLMEAERDFRVELMKKLKGRGGQGQESNGRR